MRWCCGVGVVLSDLFCVVLFWLWYVLCVWVLVS